MNTEINEALRTKAIDELIFYKKDMGWAWDKAIKYLVDIDTRFEYLHDIDFKTYKVVSQEILEAAQKKFISDTSEAKGIAIQKERWCFSDHLYMDKYWKTFKEMMSGWKEARWKNVEYQTFEMVNYLTDPRIPIGPNSDPTVKGLVYGNVQSGKTAHIASLIALYVSMGCQLTIVFSGVTKSLRLQTENRLRNDLGIDGYGSFDLITAETDLLSKKTPNIEGKLYQPNIRPVIGVFKKSPAALSRLKKYLTTTNDVDFWRGRQILIIDDECDQYGTNNKPMYTDDEDNGKPCDRSTINGLLVSILNVFDRYCYVGFTATPFANILNELPGKDSIYPKDFIYSLDQDKNYYGAQKIFGSVNDDPEQKPIVLNAVVRVNPDELDPKMNSYNPLPDAVKKAVYYFITGTACKYYRGMSGEHSSMLLHIDLKKNTHACATKAMEEFVMKEIQSYSNATKLALKTVWEEERYRIQLETIEKLFMHTEEELAGYKRPEFKEMEPYVKEVIEKLKVVMDNSDVKMEDRLSYPKDKSAVYIVIGGNTLSRGLTLEGLLVSVFYRSSSLYDTLLQMGRWFGYRYGYEDLARIYTTGKIAYKYQELAAVEENLRAEFEKYTMDVTPALVSSRIRKMPSLQITRKMAMQAAISTGINYSGSRPSTLFFPHYDTNWLKHNIIVTQEFLKSIDKPLTNKNGIFLFEGLSLKQIQNYVVAMNIHRNNKACNKELILKFLKKAEDKAYLKKWNVAVMTNISNTNGDLFLRDDILVNLIERSRLNRNDPKEETVYIKILQQPNNMFLDTDLNDSVSATTEIQKKFILRHKYFENRGEEEPGLMVIYPISKHSEPDEYDPKSKDNHRLPLDTPEHVIGLMFTFPSSKDIELDEYMTIALPTEMEDND